MVLEEKEEDERTLSGISGGRTGAAEGRRRGVTIKGDRVFFASGRTRYANGGVIGVSPDLEVSDGWDGGFWSVGMEDHADDPLTRQDLEELADYMIGQWDRFKESIRARPGRSAC
jgi:hypothetical protein